MPMGSAGDVHPFVGLGAALRDRGHEVTVITNEHFAPLVARVGLEFVQLGSEAEFNATLDNPALWDGRRGFETVMGKILQGLRPSYDLIAERHVPGETVVVGSMLGFGARIAHEALGVPYVSVHLQPSVLRSLSDPPVYPTIGDLARWPRLIRRWLYRFMDAAVIDRLLCPAVNTFRAEQGLPPVKRVFHQWIHSPQLVLGLFPEWLSPPQPDWPPNVRLTGFPLYDEATIREAEPEVERFLDDGEPPIVVTPGSAMKHGEAFFTAVIEALRRSGRRGMLLTRFPDQLPRTLPDGVAHFDYIPFSRVLPRAAAIVHHGGIGTTAQALAAGIPQLLMPMAHDQPDNAHRLQRLGVARALPPARFQAAAVKHALDELAGSGRVTERCRELAAQVAAQRDGLDQAARAIERLCVTRPAVEAG